MNLGWDESKDENLEISILWSSALNLRVWGGWGQCTLGLGWLTRTGVQITNKELHNMLAKISTEYMT